MLAIPRETWRAHPASIPSPTRSRAENHQHQEILGAGQGVLFLKSSSWPCKKTCRCASQGPQGADRWDRPGTDLA